MCPCKFPRNEQNHSLKGYYLSFSRLQLNTIIYGVLFHENGYIMQPHACHCHIFGSADPWSGTMILVKDLMHVYK